MAVGLQRRDQYEKLSTVGLAGASARGVGLVCLELTSRSQGLILVTMSLTAQALRQAAEQARQQLTFLGPSGDWG